MKLEGKFYILILMVAFLVSCSEMDVKPNERVQLANFITNPNSSQEFIFYNQTYKNDDWTNQYYLKLIADAGTFDNEKILQLESLSDPPLSAFKNIGYLGDLHRFTYQDQINKEVTIGFKYDFKYLNIPESQQSNNEKYFLSFPDSIKLYRAKYNKNIFKYYNSGDPLEISEVTDFEIDKSTNTITFNTNNLSDYFFAGFEQFPKNDTWFIDFTSLQNMDYRFTDKSWPSELGTVFYFSGPGGGVYKNRLEYKIQVDDYSKYFNTGGNIPELYSFYLSLEIDNIKKGVIDPDDFTIALDVVNFGKIVNLKKRFYSDNNTKLRITKIDERGGFVQGRITGSLKQNGTWVGYPIEMQFKIKRLY